MRNFMMLFNEKEGTSALVRQLDAFSGISLLHHVGGAGWEPFEPHNCGAMSLRDLERCLDLFYADGPLDIDRLNSLYAKSGKGRLAPCDPDTARGFKKRFSPPPMLMRPHLLGQATRVLRLPAFRRMLVDVLRRHRVMVLMAVRQDIFRWGLSKYHGDGTGRPGHLQFKLASGEIGEGGLNRITVDAGRFERILRQCEAIHRRKQRQVELLEQAGIECFAVRYEDFVSDKAALFADICRRLGVPVAEGEVERVAGTGSRFKKVHADDISSFVANHEEVLDRFGDRFIAWP